MADRGKEDSRMYQKRGLVYTALDDNGNKIGTPIKASDFHSKPTLKYLEEKFILNQNLRQQHHKHLKTEIRWVLVKREQSLTEFTQSLAKQGVSVVLRQSAAGNIYGLTYVDFKNKCVFNGSDLGKEFSAKGIMEQLRPEQKQDEVTKSPEQPNEVKQDNRMQQRGESKDQEHSHEHKNNQQTPNILELLMKPERN